MKLISLKEQSFKTIKYFGIVISVPEEVLYVAVDEDGEVYGYEIEPHYNIHSWDAYYNNHFLGVVDLEGMDWKETLRGYNND